jgi:hypothetical protein
LLNYIFALSEPEKDFLKKQTEKQLQIARENKKLKNLENLSHSEKIHLEASPLPNHIFSN